MPHAPHIDSLLHCWVWDAAQSLREDLSFEQPAADAKKADGASCVLWTPISPLWAGKVHGL